MPIIRFNPDQHSTEREAIGTPFPYTPPGAAWLVFLDQNPVISPNFADTLAMRARKFVWEWLEKHAPDEIRQLYSAAEDLELYWKEFEASKGYVSEDSNSSILETVANTVNALDKIGDTWTNTTP